MSTFSPLRVAIIGLGGFAQAHHRAILNLEKSDDFRLIASCDPGLARFAPQIGEFRFAERGVRLFTDYLAMLDACSGELDLVIIPTPIPLHEEMHRAAVERGLAVYLEKPPTLDYLELERMIATDRTARYAALVGFNFIVEPLRLALKDRLLAGEFGALREVRLLGRWPRPVDYFERNAWAGRLRGLDGRVILDSVLGNAMAHYVHNALFWAGGPARFSWASLDSVQARLFRAYRIEGADTFFVAAHTAAGPTLRLALTHTHTPDVTHRETVVCADATFHYQVGAGGEIRWQDGRIEPIAHEPFETLEVNHRAYLAYLRGELDRPATRLIDSRPFVMLNNLAHVSSGTIQSFAPERLHTHVDPREQKNYCSVAGLTAAQDAFLATGTWPADLGAPPEPPPLTTAADLSRFHATVAALASTP